MHGNVRGTFALNMIFVVVIMFKCGFTHFRIIFLFLYKVFYTQRDDDLIENVRIISIYTNTALILSRVYSPKLRQVKEEDKR